jgi:protoheme IX farnesyltransferase
MTPATAAVDVNRSRLTDLLVLTKIRLNALAVATTAGGYYMGSAGGRIDPLVMLNTCLGAMLVASGAAALNQIYERDLDRLMERTRSRPVAQGRMGVVEAGVIGYGLAAVGLVALWLGSGRLAAAVALATIVSYAVVYTPLKRRTSLATIVGAVPGALPPIIGWAAARGSIAEPAAWSLFLIMFLWQLPHFLAIAWMYREDYARAGLPMLPVIDRGGGVTGRQAALYAATLLLFSLLPAGVGLTYPAYAVGAFVLGLGLLGLAVRFAIRRTREAARGLFLGSLMYLPLLWGLMAFERR